MRFRSMTIITDCDTGRSDPLQCSPLQVAEADVVYLDWDDACGPSRQSDEDTEGMAMFHTSRGSGRRLISYRKVRGVAGRRTPMSVSTMAASDEGADLDAPSQRNGGPVIPGEGEQELDGDRRQGASGGDQARQRSRTDNTMPICRQSSARRAAISSLSTLIADNRAPRSGGPDRDRGEGETRRSGHDLQVTWQAPDVARPIAIRWDDRWSNPRGPNRVAPGQRRSGPGGNR